MADPAGREQTVAFWVSRGAPPQVAEGIADRVNAESGFKPTVVGDNGTSVGLYQHHADRKARLQALPNWADPMTQHRFAYAEVTGGDAIATKHWQEILAAPDRKTAALLWDRYFERSAGGVAGGGSGGGRMLPLVDDRRRSPVLDDDVDDGTPRAARAVASVTAPPAQPQPEQQAAAAPVQAAPLPAPMFQGRLQSPIAGVPAPDLSGTYRGGLASILSGRRRPMSSIFG